MFGTGGLVSEVLFSYPIIMQISSTPPTPKEPGGEKVNFKPCIIKQMFIHDSIIPCSIIMMSIHTITIYDII